MSTVTATQLQEFDRRGVILLAGPLTPGQLAAAAAAAAALTPRPQGGAQHVRADAWPTT